MKRWLRRVCGHTEEAHAPYRRSAARGNRKSQSEKVSIKDLATTNLPPRIARCICGEDTDGMDCTAVSPHHSPCTRTNLSHAPIHSHSCRFMWDTSFSFYFSLALAFYMGILFILPWGATFMQQRLGSKLATAP